MGRPCNCNCNNLEFVLNADRNGGPLSGDETNRYILGFDKDSNLIWKYGLDFVVWANGDVEGFKNINGLILDDNLNTYTHWIGSRGYFDGVGNFHIEYRSGIIKLDSEGRFLKELILGTSTDAFPDSLVNQFNNSLFFHTDEYIYCLSLPIDGINKRLYKLDTNLNIINTYIIDVVTGNFIGDIKLDNSGNFFTNYTGRQEKYDNLGNFIWRFTSPDNPTEGSFYLPNFRSSTDSPMYYFSATAYGPQLAYDSVNDKVVFAIGSQLYTVLGINTVFKQNPDNLAQPWCTATQDLCHLDTISCFGVTMNRVPISIFVNNNVITDNNLNKSIIRQLGLCDIQHVGERFANLTSNYLDHPVIHILNTLGGYVYVMNSDLRSIDVPSANMFSAPGAGCNNNLICLSNPNLFNIQNTVRLWSVSKSGGHQSTLLDTEPNYAIAYGKYKNRIYLVSYLPIYNKLRILNPNTLETIISHIEEPYTLGYHIYARM